MRMNRRKFVKVIGAGGVVALAPATFAGCEEKQLEALRSWEGPSVGDDGDVRLKIVSFAILAPNAHNKQPWVVDIRGEGIDLYIDRSRLLPQTDPPARQITISQGTFLELLAIAATHYGFRADIALFPRGIDSLEAIGTHPVAHVAITENAHAAEDELFGSILKRHTNRRAYTGPPLSENEVTALQQSCGDDQFPFRLITEAGRVSEIAAMMTEAMRIETYNRPMHAETVEMLRFDDEETEKYRDGITFPNLGITGMTLFFARMFARRSTAFDESFLERTVESVRESAFSSQAVGLISSRGMSRTDEVTTGRCFARLFLTATKLGLSLQPMSQVMEIQSIKSQFVKSMELQNEEPQMLFRLGRSSPTPHSPRRALNDYLRKA